MKPKDIVRQVNRDLEEEYENADIVDWGNRCLDDLTPVAKREADQQYAIITENSYDLPADFHKEVCVLVNGCEYDEVSASDRQSMGYRKWAGKLVIQGGPDSGTIDLLYYRRLQRMDTSKMDVELDLEIEFHDLPILYATGMLQFTEEEYDRPDAMKKYEQRKQQYQMFIASRQAPLMMRVE